MEPEWSKVEICLALIRLALLGTFPIGEGDRTAARFSGFPLGKAWMGDCLFNVC